MFKSLTDKRFMFVSFIQAGCIGHCVFEYLTDLVTTDGPSMQPTLYTNNLLMTERLSKRFQNFERGDIVIAKSPIEPQQMICKRIIGLPGDKIHIKPKITLNPFGSSKSQVTHDEKTADELVPFFYDDDDDNEYDSNKSKHINNQDSSMRTFRSKFIFVPKGHVWLEGDNSENSIDSRTYGPVPMGLIQSRAAARLYPEPTLF